MYLTIGASLLSKVLDLESAMNIAKMNDVVPRSVFVLFGKSHMPWVGVCAHKFSTQEYIA